MICSILIDGDVAGYQLEYWKINVSDNNRSPPKLRSITIDFHLWKKYSIRDEKVNKTRNNNVGSTYCNVEKGEVTVSIIFFER